MDALIYNKEFELISIVDEYKSFIWVDRYYGAGDFELVLPISSPALRDIARDYYVTIPGETRYMLVEDINTKTDEENGVFTTLTGRSLESLLDRRVIWDFTNQDSTLQTVVADLVDKACVHAVDTNRNFPGLRIQATGDSVIAGMAIDGQFHGQNLYDLTTKICSDRGISYKITMPTLGDLVWMLYRGADRTSSQSALNPVIFSPEYDNLENSEFLMSTTSWRNWCLVTGEGSGKAKVKTQISTGAYTGFDRREMYVDASNIARTTDGVTLSEYAYQVKLQERAKYEIAPYKNFTYFDGEAANTTNYVYGIDFNIGDVVELSDGYGNSAKSRVTEYIRSYTEDEEKEYPTLSALG